MPTVLDFNRLRDTLLPEWTKPENASVFDPAYRAPIRKIISLLGLDDPQQVMALGTPLETGSMAGGAVEAISKRFPRFAEALKVYHGSPHDFEKFDASKIGTGEGAQAYGHGLYFAENPKVAGAYQKNLSKFGHMSEMPEDMSTSILLDNKVVSGRTPSNQLSPRERAALSVHYARGNRAEAIRGIEQEMLPYLTKGSEAERIELETLNALKNEDFIGKIKPFNGRMYEVAVHADPEHFLDWDKPLSQQSQYVQDAARKASESIRGRVKVEPGQRPNSWLIKLDGQVVGGSNSERQAAANADDMIREMFDPKMTGNELYNRMAGSAGDRYGGPTQRAASEELRKAGISGLKYFDQASRKAGEGSRNYVVFAGNEHLIDILKKYGIAATTGVGITGGFNDNASAR